MSRISEWRLHCNAEVHGAGLPRLEAAQAVSFIEAAAPGTAGENFVRKILELAAAGSATINVPESEALPPLPPPLEDEPCAEDRSQHPTQADEYKDAEGNSNHGRAFGADGGLGVNASR